MPVITALRKLRQEDDQFKACLDYRERLSQEEAEGWGKRELRVNMTRMYYVHL